MRNLADFKTSRWANPSTIAPKTFVCGYCGSTVSSEKGFAIHHVGNVNSQNGGVYICPSCQSPTFFPPGGAGQVPGSSFGNKVQYVPADLDKLYTEARDCVANGDYTASVLICRKMLMNIAVGLKAKEGLSFVDYVDYISDNGYVPPNGKQWVDHIRKKGNEANHKIVLMSEKDAKELIVFIEMLLKFIFEFPNLIPPAPAPTPAPPKSN